jgi:hypothetical protein
VWVGLRHDTGAEPKAHTTHVTQAKGRGVEHVKLSAVKKIAEGRENQSKRRPDSISVYQNEATCMRQCASVMHQKQHLVWVHCWKLEKQACMTCDGSRTEGAG